MRIRRPAILFLTSTIIGILIAYRPLPTLFKLLIGLVAIFLYLKLFFENKISIKTIVAIFIFAILGCLRFQNVEKAYDAYDGIIERYEKGNQVLTGEIENIGKSTNRHYIILKNTILDGYEIGRGKIYSNYKTDLKIGNSVKVVTGIKKIEAPANEGEFNQKNYYRSDDISYIGFQKNIEVVNTKYDKFKQTIYEIKLLVNEQIGKIFDEKDAGLFSAMVTGDKSEIDIEQKRLFTDNGISHILAISGLHLSILGLAFFELLRKKFSVNKSAMVVSVFILLYGVFIDASAASLRAIVMLYIRFLALSICRTYDSKNTLYIICFIFLMLRPYLLFNAGFQFSYVAIFALNHKVEIIKYNYKPLIASDGKTKIHDIDRIKNSKTSIPQVIVLNIMLFPITVFHYFTYPPYSIILNLLVIPLMSFVLGFGLLGLLVSFAFLELGKMLSSVVHVIFAIYDKICYLIEKVPYHLILIGKPNIYWVLYFYVAIFLAFYYISRKEKNYKLPIKLKKSFIAILLLTLSILNMAKKDRSDMRMTFLSIGQGDSMIIELNDKVLSIDGGSSSNTSNGKYILAPHLKSRAISKIDHAFISHADSDHTNGILHLLNDEDNIRISKLYLPINATVDKKFDKLKNVANDKVVEIIYLKESDTIKINEKLKLEVLSPSEEVLKLKKMDQNELSLTFRIDYDKHSALFTGDIGAPSMNNMLKNGNILGKMDADILKVPHHGSKNSNVKEFFDNVSPMYSVVSYGKNNTYGHPSAETVESITNTGSKVLKTAESGQIDIYFDKPSIYYTKFYN